MDEFQPFRETVLARPGDPEPRLVWADRLDELGDSRGAWLRYWCDLEAAALIVPLDGPPGLALQARWALRRYPGNRPLLAVVLAGLTPVGRRQRARDLLDGPDDLRALTNAGLTACGLAQRTGPLPLVRVTEAACAASPEGVLDSIWAMVSRGDSEDFVAASGVLGWQVRCVETLAALPLPPPWGGAA